MVLNGSKAVSGGGGGGCGTVGLPIHAAWPALAVSPGCCRKKHPPHTMQATVFPVSPFFGSFSICQLFSV